MTFLEETVNLLKERKKLFISLFIFLSFLFIGSYVTSDRVYISSIKLAHNSVQSSAGGGFNMLFSSLSPSNVNSVQSSTTSLGMIPEVVKSRSFLDKILVKEFQYRGNSKKLYLILQNKEFSEDLNTPFLMHLARKKLSKKILVSKNLNNPVIGISISANEKSLAFDIANEVLEQLEIDLTNFQLERIEKKIDVINSQVNLIKKELTILEEDLRDFRINNSSIYESPSLRMEESRKIRDISAVISTYSSLRVELELTKTKFLEEANVLQIIDAPNFPAQKSAPRLTYTVLKLIMTFLFITFFYIYVKLFLRSALGRKIQNALSGYSNS